MHFPEGLIVGVLMSACASTQSTRVSGCRACRQNARYDRRRPPERPPWRPSAVSPDTLCPCPRPSSSRCRALSRSARPRRGGEFKIAPVGHAPPRKQPAAAIPADELRPNVGAEQGLASHRTDDLGSASCARTGTGAGLRRPPPSASPPSDGCSAAERASAPGRCS